jgi:hypothetical protein
LIELFKELNLYVNGAAIQASPNSGIPESGPPIELYIVFIYSCM